MAKPSRFIWCGLHQQRRILGSCPKCDRFPCQALKPGHLAIIAETTPLVRALAKVTKRRIAPMFFLVKADQSLTPYRGSLDNLPPQLAAEALEALECSSYIVQELTWVLAGKEKKVKVPGGGKKTLCVVETAGGELTLAEADPAERMEEGAKLYPVDKRYLRQYVPVKVSLADKEPAPASRPAPKAAARKVAAK